MLALNRLVEENPTNASELALNAIENNRYVDDILLASDSLSDLEIIATESIDLVEVVDLNCVSGFPTVMLNRFC